MVYVTGVTWCRRLVLSVIGICYRRNLVSKISVKCYRYLFLGVCNCLDTVTSEAEKVDPTKVSLALRAGVNAQCLGFIP